MTKKIMLIAAMSQNIPRLSDCEYVGIDKGALTAIRAQLPLICAIGDFDSVTETEKAEIAAQCPIETLSKHKDETDSEKGILYALEHGYDEIILYGGLGGRIDQTTAKWDHYIKRLKKGSYQIPKLFTYLSFLALEKTVISEAGVAYPLNRRMITPKDIYPISNEIIDDYAEVTIHEGSVIMFQCEDTNSLK